MTDTRVSTGSDRLPWLQDAPAKRATGSLREIWMWGAGAVLLVAGASYWLGVQSRNLEQQQAARSPASVPAVTTPLPQPRNLPPADEIQIAPTPEITPSPAPEVSQTPSPIVNPAPTHRPAPATNERVAQKATSTEEVEKPENAASQTDHDPGRQGATPPVEREPALAPARSLTLWPSRVTTGAYGRVVQIGAFGSPHQAKLGWQRMARAYPGVKRLPAVVVEAHNSFGRPFYRFQIGTTSQAHSEVLCQRMDKIHFSCAVVGLPWKPKGVER